MKKVSLGLAVFFFLQGYALAATDVYDVLRHLPIQRIEGQQTLNNAHIYAAQVDMTLTDKDGNNSNFNDGDVMDHLFIHSIGGSLLFPVGNKNDIQQFATQNADKILKILFPGGFGSNTLGQSDSQLTSSLTFDNVVTPLQSPKSVQVSLFRNELSGRVEYADLRVNGEPGYSIGGLLDYQHIFGDKFKVGVLLPYRYTSLDDSVNTRSHYVQLDLYGQYTLYDKVVKINVGADAFASGIFVRSDAVQYSGNIGYGGGVFSSIIKEFHYFTITSGIGVKVTDRTVGFTPTGSDFVSQVIDAINNKDVDTDLTYGFNLAIPYKENLMLNVGVHRTNSFASDVPSERDSQTKVRVVGQYALSERFELNAGYSAVLEIEDVTDNIFFLSAIGHF